MAIGNVSACVLRRALIIARDPMRLAAILHHLMTATEAAAAVRMLAAALCNANAYCI